MKQVEKWRKRDKSSARVDEIPTYRGSHELQNEKIEFREPVWSAMVTLSECDLSRYEPQFVPGPRAIHKYFVAGRGVSLLRQEQREKVLARSACRSSRLSVQILSGENIINSKKESWNTSWTPKAF